MAGITLLAAQIAVPPTPTRAARDAHVARMAAAIDARLAQRRADVVVLPELSTVEYSRASFDRLEDLADPVEASPCLQTFGDVARRHGAHIVVGMPLRAANGFRISLVVIAPDGTVAARYDKLHICQYGASMEKEYFTRGDGICTFDVAGLRLAPIICYDIRFPELTRALCLDRGADVILHCGAYARDESFASWHAFVTTRAMENQCYLLSLNRAGPDFGASAFAGPWVDGDQPLEVFGDGEEFRYLDIDPEEIARVRAGYTFLPDRLDDYGAL